MEVDLKKPVTEELHGCFVTDHFRWLEDKSNPAVIDWTQKQHDETMKYLDAHCPPVDGLEEELTAYIDRDFDSPIIPVSDRKFFYRRKKGDAQRKLYTVLNGKETLLFDPFIIHKNCSISRAAFSLNGDKVAVGTQISGDEIVTVYILDTVTGSAISKPLENLYSFLWARDENYLYISIRTREMIDNQVAVKIYLHRIGDDHANDKLLIAPDDAKLIAYYTDAVYSNVTFQGIGDFYSTHSLKMRLQSEANSEFREIFASTKFRVTPFALDDKIYYYTNYNAPNFKLCVASIDSPNFESSLELYGNKESVLEGYAVTKKHLLIVEKKDVINKLILCGLDGKVLRELTPPEPSHIASTWYNREIDTVFVATTSFSAPYRIYKIDPATLDNKEEWVLYYEKENPIDSKDFETEMKFCVSKDGTKIPIFITKKKDTKLDRNNPTLLYGYGGFNIGIKPDFIGVWALFVKRGGIFVEAGIRGGNEYGEKWHENGMLLKKQNTFDDFISTAEYMINESYTCKEKLSILGGSNGGLLVGAAITQRPDLFQCAISAVPLLDMVRYHKFLIARYWIPEYGSADVEEDFRNLLQYSPYHNIRSSVSLPTTLVSAGEYDTRVDPLHAKKFVAAAQGSEGQKNPVLLHMDFDSGHGPGKSTKHKIETRSVEFRFIMNTLGMNKCSNSES